MAKLEIDADELAKAPPLSMILGQAAGGLDSVIAAMRFSDDPNIETLLDAFDSATDEDRKLLPLEAFCLLAKVDIPQVLGAAILALGVQSANTVKVIAVSSHPATTRARIRNALKPGGVRDRNALDTALRFLPQPKGSTTLIQLPGGVVVQPNPDDVDAQDLFPDLSETQKMLTE